MVDEDGKPLKVYHGTDADFNVFDMTRGRANMDIQGAFFSPYEMDAEGYGGNVRAFYLRIKNPADEGTAYKALNRFKGQNGAGVKARQYFLRHSSDISTPQCTAVRLIKPQIKKRDLTFCNMMAFIIHTA